MVETMLYDALQALVAGQMFPDVAPVGVPKPYITYQQVGGQDTATMGGVAALRNARMQINVWAETRLEASQLMNQIIPILTADPIRARPYGDAVSRYEDETKLYGAELDFSIWHTP